MSLPLTPDTLAAAYDLFCTTPPFDGWNMPPSEDVVFKVSKTTNVRGTYRRRGGKHVISISAGCVGHMQTLMDVMAHEMVHLHQAQAGMENTAQHNAAFRLLAKQVCDVHGFDPVMFC